MQAFLHPSPPLSTVKMPLAKKVMVCVVVWGCCAATEGAACAGGSPPASVLDLPAHLCKLGGAIRAGLCAVKGQLQCKWGCRLSQAGMHHLPAILPALQTV